MIAKPTLLQPENNHVSKSASKHVVISENKHKAASFGGRGWVVLPENEMAIGLYGIRKK